MSPRVHASHRIVVDAPVDKAFMFFTPAGEEWWVDGWKPAYVYPPDGRTESGMVFTTGEGDALTIWSLIDFDLEAHWSRYSRCTPASRTSIVDVRCVALDDSRTAVCVSYTVTALNAAGKAALKDFEGERFAAMIDDWADKIGKCRERLLAASIR
ncbi:SRPBCC family protein [Trinickia caryophylli]|uniref:Polyketide cyclase / dehydrase and lipid transport n=1 Tax=Trinickia caryophylli TaxID=28094 RepID=A0A1X7DH19_TRICW|nr:hypothetical protein [Trinickia caryophylli]PMS12341.1 hypothetical protein C0Z17_10290 [Trinickia caryophylli]TRX16984.1 SRPBCC family protein [Trinickia caryophylli]WQE12278.1 SRPBCC family protein [Trinickia caryophylli]SMF15484.1 hypothetical protein SAMN06295900_103207 [Trinickia caryophylli]GLU31577.1 hypothetical protein Busp01_14190 [Trinickia caryophylli]